MNNLKKNNKNDDNSIGDFSKSYFSRLVELLSALDQGVIVAFMEALEEARRAGKMIFITGNGGSASTASHMAVDFGASAFKASKPDSSFRAHSLTDNAAMITAIGNDFGYEHVFTKQLEIQYCAGDILIVISASGNSRNVVNAAKWVRARKGKVLGLLGFDGGKLKDICDVSIIVNTPKGEYGPVEDIHLILDHVFTSWMHLKFADGQKLTGK